VLSAGPPSITPGSHDRFATRVAPPPPKVALRLSYSVSR
jgi:hypothetical protein